MRGSTPPSFMSWTITVLTLHCNYFDLRTPSCDCSTLDCQQNISQYTTISFLHTHSPWHSQPASSISPSKNNSQRRTTEASSRRSLLWNCQTVPRFTRERNSILAHNNSTALSPCRMCTKLTNAQQHYVQTGYAEFQQNLSVNVVRVDRHAFRTLCSQRQSYSINCCVRLRYRIVVKWGGPCK